MAGSLARLSDGGLNVGLNVGLGEGLPMADKVKLTEAQEYLTMLNRSIAKDESETRERVERCSGLDGDADLVSRQEWRAHHDRCAPLRAERDTLIKTLVATLPMPAITIPAGRALLSSGKTGE